MKNKEPTDDEIIQFILINPQHSYYTAKEKLRDLAYNEDYGDEKPEGMDWGIFWKTY